MDEDAVVVLAFIGLVAYFLIFMGFIVGQSDANETRIRLACI